jgi:hypothetical protein
MFNDTVAVAVAASWTWRDIIDGVLALLTVAMCGLVNRFLDRITALEAANERKGIEIRDVRADCAHIRGACGLAPFPYQGD